MSVSNVVLATHNKGKIAELGEMLAGYGIKVTGLAAFPQLDDIPETGLTFAQNALIKARTVARETGLVAIADDSGLMVDALSGAPGVYSARYSDDWPLLPGESVDARNIRKLLHELAGAPVRSARFETVMAAVAPTGQEIVASGQWEGQILRTPQGANGFGYDPVFFDPKLDKSAAQLTSQEKSAVSHRGKALRALLAKWPGFLLSLGSLSHLPASSALSRRFRGLPPYLCICTLFAYFL